MDGYSVMARGVVKSGDLGISAMGDPGSRSQRERFCAIAMAPSTPDRLPREGVTM